MLDKDQQEVIDYTGNAIIDAGPGAGKTRVVAEKIAQLLSDGWMPNELLPLTFSKSAAKELDGRVPIPVHTFHSFALAQLPNKRRVIPAHRTGWDKRRDFICTMHGLSEEDYYRSSETQRLVETILSTIDRYKSRLDMDLPSEIETDYKLYQAFLEEEGYIDFNDMLRLSLKQLEKKHLHFTWVFVDEGHDTSMLQYEILSRLEIDNLWVVYSPHQMIYRWNDADERNIQRVRSDYNPKEFKLRNNYRSGPQIIKALETLYKDNLVPLGPEGAVQVIQVNHSTGLRDFSSVDRKALDLSIEYDKDAQVLARTNKELAVLRQRRIPCSTLHSSKGTEYETVILLNCDKDHMPHYYSSDTEEEKNLLYVGMSRAKKNLFLLYQDYPSPFIRRLRR